MEIGPFDAWADGLVPASRPIAIYATETVATNIVFIDA
jgi:hypothetical protein